MKRRLTAILAADVVGYSRLMEQDEMGTLRLLTVAAGGSSGPPNCQAQRPDRQIDG